MITLTTIGYGDFAPETAGKLFTAVYALVGVGILLAFVTTVATKVSTTTLLHAAAGPPARDGSPTPDRGSETRPSHCYGAGRVRGDLARLRDEGAEPVSFFGS